ncbi:YggT family protein [Alkalimarinus sediminis]|uniref:YggT family protein n=1 Tax=Alkalimarinus sediminis TaxID=1632866 RepID=A0A9E8KQW0_9ALTE|nr:YggT family protein [Alkalimarinus sediminis]UZW75292.1 YggT family protein [Alkalimarinus sediminis]
MDSLFAEIGLMFINLVFGLYLLVVLLRFLFQLVRADFYNPISQFVLKATNPLLMPIRKVVPSIGSIDTSSLVLALAVQLLGALLTLLIVGAGIDPLMLVVWSLCLIVNLILQIYFFGLIITVIVSWIAPQSQNPAIALIHQLLAPVTNPIRKMLPDMGGIDISPIFVFFIIMVLKKVVYSFMASSSMPLALAMFV